MGVVDGETVLAEAAEAYRVALGDRLAAAYALGSLAHDGFSPLVSDIDLGLVLSDPLLPGDADTIQTLADTEKSKGSALHQRLSVFWGTPSTLQGEQRGGRFPALDRLDLIENGGCSSAPTRRAMVCHARAPANSWSREPSSRLTTWLVYDGRLRRQLRGWDRFDLRERMPSRRSAPGICSLLTVCGG